MMTSREFVAYFFTLASWLLFACVLMTVLLDWAMFSPYLVILLGYPIFEATINGVNWYLYTRGVRG
jgi:hypothetical protein